MGGPGPISGVRFVARATCVALAVVASAFVAAEFVRAEPEAVPAQVVHYLPFPVGVTYKVWQGNDQGPSHNDQWNRHAFDFSPLPESSPICATADGTVVYVKEDTAGPTGDWHDNNEVAILHADGAVGTYLHLEQDGATVEVGDVVFAGDVIGRAGNTGKSTARHLHFGLRQGKRRGPSIPCRFADAPGDGIPDTGDLVTSGNVAGRPLHAAIGDFEALYDAASEMNAREALSGSLRVLPKRPPRAIASALEALAGRRDFVDLYVKRRDVLLARHIAEATRDVERLRASVAAGGLDDAVFLATIGKREFADLDARKAFTAELKTLRAGDTYTAVLKAVRPRLSLREKIVRAIERDLDTRDKAARGRRVRWKSVADLYAKALAAADALGAAGTVDRLRALRALAAARLTR